VICAGYALAIKSFSSQSVYPYTGEWHSQAITPEAQKLCLELSVSAQDTWQVSVDLLTSDIHDQQNTQRKTVFEASDRGDGRIKLVTELPLDFQVKMTSLAKLVVYMSTNMTLHHVSFKPNSCPLQS
jgi:hypothetical protein